MEPTASDSPAKVETEITLDRSAVVREMLQSPRLTHLVSRIAVLPSVPETYSELVDELASESSTAVSIGQIVARDPALTAKVLQIVNSAVFGFARSIVDPGHAVGLLGIDTVKALVLSVGAFNEFENVSVGGITTRKIAEHGLRVADIAARISRLERAPVWVVHCSFTAGLLHDIGKLILARELASIYSCLIEVVDQDDRKLVTAETQVLGATHAAVGAYLLAIWGLPQELIEAVALHHSAIPGCREFSALTALKVGNLLSRQTDSVAYDVEKTEVLMHLRDIGCEFKFDMWQAECKAA